MRVFPFPFVIFIVKERREKRFTSYVKSMLNIIKL